MFRSIPDTFWWCMVTFTTVGYGDQYPRTPWGRIIAGVTMFCGIFFMAMPLTIVGSAFADAWVRFEQKRLRSDAHARQVQGLWVPDPERVVSNRIQIRAHLLRQLEIFKDMKNEAHRTGAGPGVDTLWEKV